MDYDKFVLLFRRYVEPFIALGVLIILVLLYINVTEGNELRTEISQNCGWEEEDYRCFCEKSEAIAIMNKMDNLNIVDEDELYVSLDR